MKKVISFVTAVFLLCSLAACGSTSGGSGIQAPNSVNTGNSTEPSSTEGSSSTGSEKSTIEETVLLDEADVKITAKSLDYDGILGPTLKLLIENNSDQNLTFQCRHTSVNGYMISSVMSVNVASGKKANDGITFTKSHLEACGIENFADMEFSFYIMDSDEFEVYHESELIQLKTSAAETYKYSFDDSGEVAYNENGVKIVVKGITDDSILGPQIQIYIENTGDKDITVQTRDVSVNGFMVTALFSSEVVSGKHAVDSISFLSSDLEDNGITEIEDVEMSFHIYDSSNYSTVADTEIISISF